MRLITIILLLFTFTGFSQIQNHGMFYDVSDGAVVLPSPVACYGFEETSGTTVNDCQSGYDGTNYGATIAQTGKINYCYDYDGVDDYCSLPQLIDDNDDVTVSLWVYFDSSIYSSDVGRFYGRGNDNDGDGWSLFLNWEKFIVIATSPSTVSRSASATTTPITSGWYHCVGVFNQGVGNYFYRNGVLMGTYEHTYTTLRSSSSYGTIGTFNNQVDFFDGKVDEVRVYDQALTSDQVSLLYALTTPCCEATPGTLPTVTTSAVTSTDEIYATLNGEVTDQGSESVSASGFCIGTSTAPDLSDQVIVVSSGATSFSYANTFNCLGTTYYIRAFATSTVGTSYGTTVTYTPSGTTTDYELWNFYTDNCNGGTTEITSQADAEDACQVFTLGCGSGSGYSFGMTSEPAVGNLLYDDDCFDYNLSDSWRIYYDGTNYYILEIVDKEIVSKTQCTVTPTTPTVQLNSYTTPVLTTTDVEAQVTSEGTESVTDRGLCWGTTTAPDLTDNVIANGSGSGIFTSEIDGECLGLTIYVRAYATNSVGTSYSDSEYEITMSDPTRYTNQFIESITITDACGGGSLAISTETDADDACTYYLGGCIDESSELDLDVLTSTISIGNEIYEPSDGCPTSETGWYMLEEGSNYYKIYISANEITTKELCTATSTTPTVTTNSSVTDIDEVFGTTGGNVTYNGGSTVSACGICWNTTGSPTIADNVEAISSGTGTFSDEICFKCFDETIYYRAYATNAVGTSYGDVYTYSTPTLPTMYGRPIVIVKNSEGTSYNITTLESAETACDLIISDGYYPVDGTCCTPQTRLLLLMTQGFMTMGVLKEVQVALTCYGKKTILTI